MALLSFRGFDTPSLPAQGEQRRFSYFNIDRDIPGLRLDSRQRSLAVIFKWIDGEPYDVRIVDYH